MPYLTHSLWSEIASYLPKEDQKQAIKRIKELKHDFNLRKNLQLRPEVSPEIIYYRNLVALHDQSSTQIGSLVNLPIHLFKLHI